eukprot:8438096-Pyramimonas_sp.AAC.1
MISQLCGLASKSTNVRMSQYQLKHNCNAPFEGPHEFDAWWQPLLTTCNNLKNFFRGAPRYERLPA